MRKGQDLAGGSDSRWNSFVQLFNEAMNNGEIPTKSPPSGLTGHEPGTVEWTESEVFDLINDEMERSKDVQAKPVEAKVAPIPLTDEQLKNDGFITEDDIDAVIETADTNIIGIKEDLYEEGFNEHEISEIVKGIETAINNQITGREFEERLAALKKTVKNTKTEQPAPTTGNQLFNYRRHLYLIRQPAGEAREIQTRKRAESRAVPAA